MPGTPTTQPLRHSHRFDQGNPLAERNTRWAVLLTACMMVAEIAGGCSTPWPCSPTAGT